MSEPPPRCRGERQTFAHPQRRVARMAGAQHLSASAGASENTLECVDHIEITGLDDGLRSCTAGRVARCRLSSGSSVERVAGSPAPSRVPTLHSDSASFLFGYLTGPEFKPADLSGMTGPVSRRLFASMSRHRVFPRFSAFFKFFHGQPPFPTRRQDVVR
jgi:hypothetical protein